MEMPGWELRTTPPERLPMTAVSTRTSPDLTFFDAAGPGLAAHFAEHGFALLRNALSPSEVAEINDEALRICRGDYGTITYAHAGDTELVDEGTSSVAASDEELLRK